MCITILKKLCNHPSLLYPKEAPQPQTKVQKAAKRNKIKDEEEIQEEEEDEETEQDQAKSFLKPLYPSGYDPSAYLPEYSGIIAPACHLTQAGKLSVLDGLLTKIKTTTKDRVILVSFFQQASPTSLLVLISPRHSKSSRKCARLRIIRF